MHPCTRILAFLLASTLMFGSNLSACQLLSALGADPHHHETEAGTSYVHSHEAHRCCDHHHDHHHHGESAHDHHSHDAAAHHHSDADPACPETDLPCSGQCQLDPDENLTTVLQPPALRPLSSTAAVWEQPPPLRPHWTERPPAFLETGPANTGPPGYTPAMSGRFNL